MIRNNSDIGIEPIPPSLLPVGQVFKTGWNLPDALSEHDWKNAGVALSRMGGAISWWIGDWWAFGEHKYGDRKAIVESEDWEGPAFQHCADVGMVCAKFETSRRREALSFTHHREVCGLPAIDADKVLDWAEANSASVKATRAKVQEVRNRLEQQTRPQRPAPPITKIDIFQPTAIQTPQPEKHTPQRLESIPLPHVPPLPKEPPLIGPCIEYTTSPKFSPGIIKILSSVTRLLAMEQSRQTTHRLMRDEDMDRAKHLLNTINTFFEDQKHVIQRERDDRTIPEAVPTNVYQFARGYRG